MIYKKYIYGVPIPHSDIQIAHNLSEHLKSLSVTPCTSHSIIIISTLLTLQIAIIIIITIIINILIEGHGNSCCSQLNLKVKKNITCIRESERVSARTPCPGD
jgi:hypothetical protein